MWGCGNQGSPSQGSRLFGSWGEFNVTIISVPRDGRSRYTLPLPAAGVLPTHAGPRNHGLLSSVLLVLFRSRMPSQDQLSLQ
jgi:hypothetical protein